MPVLIVIEHGPAQRFIMVAPAVGENMISPIMSADWDVRGNPYIAFKAACEEFTGCDVLDLNITVAHCSSGDLSHWG